MKHLIPHPLSRENAKRVLEAAHADYAQRFAKYAPRLTWLSAEHARVSLHAMGRELEGSVRLLEHGLEVEVDVPLMLRPFVGPAKSAIEREVMRRVSAFKE